MDRQCVADALGRVIIDWRLWWMDLFSLMSVVSIFALLMVGAYLLVSDLDREERRGTLNFIRLSPQTAPGILLGKLLGVPTLLYLVAICALPLHLWAGVSAQIPLLGLATFYAVLLASVAFFFSAALLFGLRTTWLGGFQPWLFSGALFMFLLWTMSANNFHGSAAWLQLLSPIITLPDLVPDELGDRSIVPYALREVKGFHLFFFPLGSRLSSLAGFALFNYGLCCYWIWQALDRCFHSPTATMISKRQSYGIVACWTLLVMGCGMVPQVGDSDAKRWAGWLSSNFQTVMSLNLVLFLGMMAALSPHRQTLQDWMRYRRQAKTAGERRRSLFHDLLLGEQSPALGAIGLNLLIVALLVTPWVLTWSAPIIQRNALVGLMVSGTMILIYAALVQIILLQRLPKSSLWAIAGLGTAILLPVMILGVLGVGPSEFSELWLFSVAPWVAVSEVVRSRIFLVVLGQFALFAGLTLRMQRQLQHMGESESKRLLKATTRG
jgi:hypothetical protein